MTSPADSERTRWSRACSGAAAAALAVSAAVALMDRGFVVAMMAAIGAAAFASNLRRPLHKRLRLLAMTIEILLLVAMAGALVTVLSIADAGRRGWEDVPWWFWALTVAAFAVVWYAIADGRKAYRH